jgi:hypothetical protein
MVQVSDLAETHLRTGDDIPVIVIRLRYLTSYLSIPDCLTATDKVEQGGLLF